jgi:hypothetical protein
MWRLCLDPSRLWIELVRPAAAGGSALDPLRLWIEYPNGRTATTPRIERSS